MFHFSKTIINTFFSLLLVVKTATLLGQADPPPVRIEFEARPNTEPYNLVPFGREGFILYTQTNEFQDRHKRIWFISLFDNNLKEKWTKSLYIPRGMTFKAQSAGDRIVAGIFYDEKSTQGNNYCIVSASSDSSSVKVFESNLAPKSELVKLTKCGDWLYLGFSSKTSGNLFRINLINGNKQELKLNADGGVFVEDISADSTTQGVVVLTSFRNIRARTPVLMHRFDESGQETSFEQVLKSESRRNITSAEYVSLPGQRWMIAGSYSSAPIRKLGASVSPDDVKSSGFYQVIFNSPNQSTTYHHSFSSFVNIENYIRGPVAETMHRRLRKLQNQGKSVQLEYNIVVQRIRQYQDLYLLNAEAFAPDYRTVTTVTYDYYGRPIPRSYSVFDGYRYSHAVVAALNDQGQLVWNGGIEMINLRSFNLDYKTSVFGDANGLVLSFYYEGKIAWKQIGAATIKDNISYVSIESSHPKDRIVAEQGGKLNTWYDNFFLASGYQTIENTYHPTTQKRNVFYINKITFD